METSVTPEPGDGLGVGVYDPCHQWCFLAGVADGVGLGAGRTW
jgi:hypothetical protein